MYSEPWDRKKESKESKRMIACDGGGRRKSVQWRLTTHLCLERCLDTDVKESTLTELTLVMNFKHLSFLGASRLSGHLRFMWWWVQPTCRQLRLSAMSAGPVQPLFSTSWFSCPADALSWSGKSGHLDDKEKKQAHVYLSKTNNPLTKLIVFAYSWSFFSLLRVSLFMQRNNVKLNWTQKLGEEWDSSKDRERHRTWDLDTG